MDQDTKITHRKNCFGNLRWKWVLFMWRGWLHKVLLESSWNQVHISISDSSCQYLNPKLNVSFSASEASLQLNHRASQHKDAEKGKKIIVYYFSSHLPFMKLMYFWPFLLLKWFSNYWFPVKGWGFWNFHFDCAKIPVTFRLLHHNDLEQINLILEQSSFQDSDGEAGIALVGVHGDYPKYANDEKYINDKEGPATVG